MNDYFAASLPESVIKRLSIEVKAVGGINLGQGIPPFPTAPHIISAAKKALDDPAIGVYPNFLGTEELRDAIAKEMSKNHKLGLSVDHVLVTVGAMEGTATAILSLLHDGERVGIVTPDYCNHIPEIMLARGVCVELPMQESTRWMLDIARIEAAAKKGLKLLILTNPNNPTGAVISANELGSLVRLADRYGFWILSDETYHFLSYADPAPSLLEFWDRSARLITVRSFSKEYAMTGWRVGYVVARPDAIRVFAKTHDALVGCVPKISQRAAIAALTGPQAVVRSYRKQFSRLRDLTLRTLAPIRDGTIHFADPEGAYYLFFRYEANRASLAVAKDILHATNVGVIPGSVFGKSGEGHIRISFASSEPNLMQGLTRLLKYFS
ncbi:pyridoxal phosphate-dependent aminotransferase [Patescibacteria group bacterium]|nr:pyridoxal phosphate-dependent aminotransferase [Patescibacteria group bacterium]